MCSVQFLFTVSMENLQILLINENLFLNEYENIGFLSAIQKVTKLNKLYQLLKHSAQTIGADRSNEMC